MKNNAISNPIEDKSLFLVQGARLLFSMNFKGKPTKSGIMMNFDHVFIIEKDNADVSDMIDQAKIVSDENFQISKKRTIYTFVNCLDGDSQKSSDGDAQESPFSAAQGCYILRTRASVLATDEPPLPPLYSPSNKNLSQMVQDGNMNVSTIRTKFYAGCYVDLLLQITAYSYDKGNVCRLKAKSIRWMKEGKRLSNTTIESLTKPADESDDPFLAVSVDKVLEEAQKKVDNSQNRFGDDVPF